MKNKLFLIAVLLCFKLLTTAQTLEVKYLEWEKDPDKTTTYYQYSASKAYLAKDVAHDFGPRNMTDPKNPYDFHGGIDYNGENSDLGDLILAVESGDIQLEGMAGSTKALKIKGDDGNYFAYVHVFTCSAVDNLNGSLLKKMEAPYSSTWVMVFRYNGNYTALGPIPTNYNANMTPKVNFTDEQGNPQTLDVVFRATSGEPVAALGGSCGYGHHFHLQGLKDVTISGLPDTNAKNPLEFVINNTTSDIPNYNLNLLKENDVVGLQLEPKGSDKSTLRARVELSTALKISNSSYKVVINQEKVIFKLKNLNNSEENTIIGPNYDKIQIGGKKENDRMPPMIIDGNDGNIGSWNHTGIHPYFYGNL